MYIVIEKWPELVTAYIVCDEDGRNKLFDTKEEAQKEADECQGGIVVEIN